MSRKIEMTWVCSSCDLRNLGRHKACQTCGNPKDSSEKYEMPGETRSVASVTDAKLLRQASAGRDWRCKYCGSDQMRLDHRCAECGAESADGAEVRDGAAPTPQGVAVAPPLPASSSFAVRPFATPTAAAAPQRGRRSPYPFGLRLGAFIGAISAALLSCALGCVALGGIAAWWSNRPRDVQVAATRWEQVVHVDRYRVFDREGFTEAQNATAFDMRPLGQRHHHDEQVFDHNETVHFTERVQDGYDSESYTEQVSCGQDCTTSPESCHEECSSDDNGFASCHNVCSGGGQSCTTRYCSETRTRQVPRYRDEPRTREEPRYRAEPRFAEWFAFKQWEWAEDRVLRESGADCTARWPSAERVHLAVGLAPGEQERERREATYNVRFADDDAASYTLVPSSETDFARFPPRSRHRIRASGQEVVELLGPGE